MLKKEEEKIFFHIFSEGFLRCVRNRFSDLPTHTILKNCPVISNDGETTSLYNIKINGTFLIGSKDSLTENDAEGFMEK